MDALARRVNIRVSTSKAFFCGHLYQVSLVSALFTEDSLSDCFSFDIVVDPQHQAKGLGGVLVDEALEYYEDLKNMMFEMFVEYDYCVHVINPHMKTLL